jgi:micrococcal nuclease
MRGMKAPRLVLPLVVCILLSIALACSVTAPAAEPTPTPTATPTAVITVHHQGNVTFTKAYCTRVIDGDTIEVLINGTEYRVRYIGIDTPEMDDERPAYRTLAEEAKQANIQLVEGKNISLQKDISETDRYGRLLRYVFDGTMFVNLVLVAEGYAWAVSYPPDTMYDALFGELQTAAQDDKLGVWQLP